jgi:hypothetical protein
MARFQARNEASRRSSPAMALANDPRGWAFPSLSSPSHRPGGCRRQRRLGVSRLVDMPSTRVAHFRNPDLPQTVAENELALSEQVINRGYTRVADQR